jgi:hypothetical protein
MSLVKLEEDQNESMKRRFHPAIRDVADKMSCCSRRTRKEYCILHVQMAIEESLPRDILDELRRWYGLGPDDSKEGREIDGLETELWWKFKKVCRVATDGYHPTKAQWPTFLATARSMGLENEVLQYTKGWGTVEKNDTSDYDFISTLIKRGEQEFAVLVTRSGGTPRDAQNLIGALQYGAEGFDQKADSDVIEKLGNLNLVDVVK